jgi:GTP cyclohydrolase I
MSDASTLFEEYLRAAGIEPEDDPEMRGTPRRFTELLQEWFTPGGEPPVLSPVPTKPNDGDLVIVRDLAFHSLCAHHIVPFFGTIGIAFEPRDTLVGFGGLNRMVQFLSRRPQLQERLVTQIADRVVEQLNPKGVVVVSVARQMCMELNGTPAGTKTVATATRGSLRGEPGRAIALRLAE